MKLVFVENRYATRLAEKVARGLMSDGHEIHWIVQNPMFKPHVGNAHVIPFPQERGKPELSGWQEAMARVADSDRQLTYHGGDDGHYAHYVSHIEALLREISPDVVFGESTQFYELLAIEICRRRGIPYLFPVTLGYPRGRMAFFAFDTRTPVGGDGTELSRSEAAETIQEINARKQIPSYMNAPALGRVSRSYLSISNRLRILASWMAGERYATPGPLSKLSVDLRHGRCRRRWDALARNRTLGTKPYILYALQLQPECAIDVWGWPWSNQARLIERLAKVLASRGMELVVKPNPRSKYEMSAELLEVVLRAPNVIPVLHKVPMREVFPAALAVVGVTGSVLLEAVFAGKPAISIGENAMLGYPGILRIAEPEAVTRVLDSVSPSSGADSFNGAFRLLSWLTAMSYPGEIFEPYFDRSKLVDREISKLTAAFRDVLTRLAAGRLRIASDIGRETNTIDELKDADCLRELRL